MTNKGIGTKLIKAALNDLVKEYKKVILWCMSENLEAMKFYKSRNFVQSKEIKVKIGDKNLCESAFIFNFEEVNKFTRN